MYSPASSYLGYVPPNSAKPVPASSYQARQVPAPVTRTDFITPIYKALGNIPIVSSAKDIVASGKMKPTISSGSRSGSGSVYSTSSVVGNSGVNSAVSLDYLNADLAKYYGMDATTAYNEALSNTAYQRAVKDMQAAGLNPAVLFGNGRVSGADGVYGARPLSASSGGSSGYSRRTYGSRSSGKLFSSDAYGAISGAGALIGAVIGAKSGHIGIGALTGSNIATSAAKVLNGFFRK